MKVGIVSDSHADHKLAVEMAKEFNDRSVECVLCAGDVVSTEVVRAFGEVEGARFIGVFGNCDHEREALSEAARGIGGEFCGEVFSGEVGGKRVYMTHIPRNIDIISNSGNFDLVVYGHTHRLDIHYDNGAVTVNPGRDAVVVVDLSDMSAEEVAIGGQAKKR